MGGVCEYIQRIAIVSVPVSDPDASKTFYTEVLGFEVIRDAPMGPDRRWIQLAPSNGEGSIALVNWFDQMPPGCVHGLVLESDGIEEDRQTLDDRGLEISEVQDAPWGRYATFADPDGNGWVLQEAGGDR